MYRLPDLQTANSEYFQLCHALQPRISGDLIRDVLIALGDYTLLITSGDLAFLAFCTLLINRQRPYPPHRRQCSQRTDRTQRICLPASFPAGSTSTARSNASFLPLGVPALPGLLPSTATSSAMLGSSCLPTFIVEGAERP